ncbi:tRNA modification GTPase [Litorivivens lipolytica]|uniref:tRNA modification GTPase MnmE n=1 Tax=Litorivivens lipolytica TaxID=1524264 RepID=A0A7W4W740_9GAMM|nr:tRNA uridine-5-carboxymethylaminomethyl(34) synthesis GTPase MnmE [Litorivivens lipolytica]MBB3048681.1 tRNA modification GTPase [Litorivivens lipolytica]
MTYQTDTIAAIATPAGRGGVGVIRISGPKSLDIACAILNNKSLKPRYAHFSNFYSSSNNEIEALDSGLALFFPGPNSFTGEDVLELQGHGGPVVLQLLLREICRLGARPAKPGEFSERAFLNDKIDLAQAEAIADLIDSASEQAAKNAVRSLEGEFSRQVNALVEALIHLRMYVEAAIDFPEEEVDFLSDETVQRGLENLDRDLNNLLANAKQGALLREGMTVAIAGKPNAGKSSLLNALAGRESAIVTDIAGTTRDVLRETILIDGMPLHVIDTAGLRDSSDLVEQEGIRRAWQVIDDADRILLVIDSTDPSSADDLLKQFEPHRDKLTAIYNKADLSGLAIGESSDHHALNLSAKAQQGIDKLREHLKDCMGYHGGSDSQFTARQRHIDALLEAKTHFEQGREQLVVYRAGELLAEELRLSQNALSTITGEFTPDDLLGKIFSSFCIGK